MSLTQIVSTSLGVMGGSAFNASMMGAARTADHAASSLSRVSALTAPLKAGIASLVGGLSLAGVASLGSSFENTQNKMAGFFTALGESSNFADGLVLAEETMRKIEITAARLPGEAEDYVRVFSQGLPQIQKAVGGSLDNMLGFTNKMTAIGSTFGIDSVQISHDLQRMLQVGKGGAGLDVRTFTEMLPFLQQVEGQANLNTEAFNKMTNVQRAELLKKSFVALQPMIDSAANSFDAMKGAILTSGKLMARQSTAPLFEGMKSGLNQLNQAFYDADGNATALTGNIIAVGRAVSTYIVDGVHQVIDGFNWLEKNGSKIFADIFAFRIGAFEDMKALSAINMEGPNAEMFSPLQRAFESAGLSINSTLAMALDPIVQTADWLASSFIYLSEGIVPVWDVMQKVSGVVEYLSSMILPALGEAVFMIIQPLTDFGYSLATLVSEGIDTMMPHLLVLGQGIVDLVIGIGEFLYPALKIIGSVFMWLATQIKDYLLPVVNLFVFTIGKVISYIGNFLGEVGKNARDFYGWEPQTKPGVHSADGVADFFGNIMRKINEQREKRMQEEHRDPTTRKSTRAPSARGGTTVNQDFRFSKFTIDQKFAEGYDPDRIAVLFAKDVGRMGSQKIQSGFEPLFSVRG